MAYLTLFDASSDAATKQCKDCGQTFPLTNFTPARGCKLGVLPRCKPCQQLVRQQWNERHPELYRLGIAKWRAANIERARAACRAHYVANKDHYAAKSRQWAISHPDASKQYSRAYKARNQERCRKAGRDSYHRRKNCPMYMLRRRATTRLHAFLSGRRSNGVIKEIGCSLKSLKTHIELLFPEGMGWHNRHEWELDHFYPLAALGSHPDDLSQRAVCNYRNLRPCWKSANRSKRCVVLPEAQALLDSIKAMILQGAA